MGAALPCLFVAFLLAMPWYTPWFIFCGRYEAPLLTSKAITSGVLKDFLVLIENLLLKFVHVMSIVCVVYLPVNEVRSFNNFLMKLSIVLRGYVRVL